MKKSRWEFQIGDKVRNLRSRAKGVVIFIPMFESSWIEVRVDRGNANHTKAKWSIKNIEIIEKIQQEMNGIIIDGKVYEVVGYPFNHCDKCDLKKECDQVTGNDCLVDKLFGLKGMRVFRYSQELTDKIKKL